MPEELVGLDPGEPGLVDHLGVVAALVLSVEPPDVALPVDPDVGASGVPAQLPLQQDEAG